MLANFADNIVGMGKSSLSNDLRYLKPLKQRSSAERLSQDTVHVLRLQRQGRMLGFTFVEDERERSHLGEELRGLALQDAIRHELACRAAELANGGDTVRDISEKLGISIASVSRYLRDKASERSENSKMGKNADFCYRLLQAHGPSLKQTSHFSGNSVGEEVPVDP